MRENRASRTAAFVAASRGFAAYLPEDEQLVRDPFGIAFGGRSAIALGSLLDRLPKRAARALLRAWSSAGGVYWMQLRSRAIDRAVEDFVARGGDQVVILGAGYDCRAFRLEALRGARVFEVDHPATQHEKRAHVGGLPPTASSVDFVPWDFEARSVAELPAALAELGHDPSRPTLTLWEGVTMYLSEEAIDASVRAVGALADEATSSTLVFNYVEREAITKKARGVGRLVALLGEPFRFGWEPASLAPWLRERGFEVAWSRRDVELAAELLPRVERAVTDLGRHVVIATRAPTR